MFGTHNDLKAIREEDGIVKYGDVIKSCLLYSVISTCAVQPASTQQTSWEHPRVLYLSTCRKALNLCMAYDSTSIGNSAQSELKC